MYLVSSTFLCRLNSIFNKYDLGTSEMESRSLGPRSGTASSNTPTLSQSPAGEESAQTTPLPSEVPSGAAPLPTLGGGFLLPVAPRPNESSSPPITSRRNELASPTSIPSCDGPLEPPPRNESLPPGIPNREDPPLTRSTARNESPLPPGTPSRDESSPPSIHNHESSPSGIPNHEDYPPQGPGAPSSDESPLAIPNYGDLPPPGAPSSDELPSVISNRADTPLRAPSSDELPSAIPDREDCPPSRSNSPTESSLPPGAPSNGEFSPSAVPNRDESPLPPRTPSYDKTSASPQRTSLLAISGLRDRLAILDGVPAYSKAIYEAVLRDALKWGELWADCVAAFVMFEKNAGFGLHDMRLPSLASRPSQMGEWFKYGRKLSGQVWEGFCKGDADAFGERWGKWWSDLQPEGRHRDGCGVFLKDNVDVNWRCLRKPGGNGVFLILVALVWWREMIDAQGLQPSRTKNWEDSVEDVKWALTCLTDGWESTGEGNESSPRQQKRR